MIRVGLTGGIGSGKSTVARVLELLGVPVYGADERAHRLSDHDPAVVGAIRELFGDRAYVRDQAGRRLDRRWVAGQVFGDPERLARLNAIVHPAVRHDFRAWAARQHAPYGVLETAILFESGFDAEVDRTVVVVAPEALRIARTIRRDGVGEQDVRRRIEAQMDDEERLRRADYVLHADERQLLIPQILRMNNEVITNYELRITSIVNEQKRML
jgi:dephospho-CoA kinase